MRGPGWRIKLAALSQIKLLDLPLNEEWKGLTARSLMRYKQDIYCMSGGFLGPRVKTKCVSECAYDLQFAFNVKLHLSRCNTRVVLRQHHGDGKLLLSRDTRNWRPTWVLSSVLDEWQWFALRRLIHPFIGS